MSLTGAEWLGWCATTVFVGSYFCARPSLLRAVQMVGALLWVLYGSLIGSSPVIVANVLVLSAAGWTAFRAAQVTAELTARAATAGSSSGARYTPVTDSATRQIDSGVPLATMRPPRSPPPGPRSTT